MVACICGGLGEVWLVSAIVSGLSVLGTSLWNRWRKRCYCRKHCCGDHDREQPASWLWCNLFHRHHHRRTFHDCFECAKCWRVWID